MPNPTRPAASLPRWLQPAPDSPIAATLRAGHSPWSHGIHLLWSAWLFIAPAMGGGRYDLRWCLLTLVSYPLFLWLYAKVLLAPRRIAPRYALAMIALCLALLPWYPSGLSYFVFGCVMLAVVRRDRLPHYLLMLLALNALLTVYALWLGYPWQVVVWMLPTTLIIGIIVHVEHQLKERDAALMLSLDEIRRLAASAERERIGRDLHDLLGHTLSLITLKLELSRKLIDRDTTLARLEITEAERIARHALGEVRAAVTGYRAAGLAAELASARLLLTTAGVSLDYDAPPALPPDTERSLALVLREAVTNIVRHAQATHAEIRFIHTGNHLQLRIRDDGRGGVATPGNGIAGMRERVRALGGQLTLHSPLREGTLLSIDLPLAATVAPQVEQAIASAPSIPQGASQ
ncbi:sensor histidine kinase [Thermomonas hydrothermalis]|uniref:Two-component system, NarL family, sensor histidine kinase DesK n=1 Tax=Thermomonas hydrothermalis TaxID=213588 RepID=A0A1M5AC19_9GAMM|nr:sensor histidine kinase [Thermomonas hydrothermalis]SHF27871.1 two-component system, NarL family, sensor histidine kinase DesK [Thermomonas hydrothermalis]